MSKWKPAYMIKGEQLTIPMSLLVEPEKAKERFVDATFVEGYRNGILVEVRFRKGIGANYKNNYKLFINWPSVWCGNVKVKDSFGNNVKAELDRR